MSTFLFDKIVFGPVKSRRLGISLGINLLPTNAKLCNFNCVYCECGLNQTGIKIEIPSPEAVDEKLQQALESSTEKPNVITFAGNGEPTMHPQFSKIIDNTIRTRNKYAPLAKIVVLSNATLLHQDSVFNALLKVDMNIQKLDSAIDTTLQLINQPNGLITVENTIEKLQKFKGKVIIQTLFLRGLVNSCYFDNTNNFELDALISAYKQIKPEKVMAYRIERDTPVDNLVKLTNEELIEIGRKIENAGLNTLVSY